ncbi:MAG: HemK/PrmC family methyltransferase [Terracidiphilus sp.]
MTTRPSPIRVLISAAERELAAGPHLERARLDAELLLLHMFGKDRAWLIAHLKDEFPSELIRPYSELLVRRCNGEPVQYITGETEFYGLPFRVTPDVLIPRPETEHLVEKVLELTTLFSANSIEPVEKNPAGAKAQDDFSAFMARLKSCPDTKHHDSSKFKVIRIVDVGTGSGAVAIALAHKLPQASITAVDLSKSALAIARENAKRNGVALRFLEGDLLAPVAGERFEIIVSNPPYVPTADRDSLSVEVRDYEPALALFAGEDGLEVYRRLIPAAFDALTPGGYLALEIGYGQSPAIAGLLTRSGFEQIEFVPDLQGIPRVACARRPR